MTSPNILVAVPAYGGSIKTGCVESLFAAFGALSGQGVSFVFKTLNIPDIAGVRNGFASFALNDPRLTHLLFIDSDMVFSPEVISSLLQSGKDVIGCVCPQRSLDIEALMADRDRDPDQAIARASKFNVMFPAETTTVHIEQGVTSDPDGLGTGVFLISRSCLEQMVATSKLRRYDNSHALHRADAFDKHVPIYGFFDPLGSDNEPSEDYAFCHRWRTLCGGKVNGLIVGANQVGHIGDFVYRASFLARLKSGLL